MALVKPLYIDAAGFPVESSPSGDSWEISGLTLQGDIAMGANNITGLAAGVAGTDAVNKSQLDQAVITGGTVKEALLYCQLQTDDAEGVLAAAAFAPSAQPVSGDTLTITDGTTTRTYGAGAGGDVQYTIGGSLAATLQNLATAIAGDGSAVWGAEYTGNLDAISTDGVVIIGEDDNDGAVSRIYGTWTTQANALHVNFDGETEYTSKTLVAIATTDPTASNPNFGMRRTQASLTDGEIHTCLESDELQSWDASTSTWFTLTGSAGIPDATGASGGGVKGKATFDTDLGLSVTSGVVSVKLATAGAGTGGVEFDGSGDIQVDLDGTTLQLAAGGVSVKGLPALFEVNGVAVGAAVTAANLDTLTDGSNADALHSHAGSTNPQETVATGGVTVGDPLYYSANDEVSDADAATDVESRGVVGIADATVTATNPVGIHSEGDLVTPAAIGGAPAFGNIVYIAGGGGVTVTRPTASGSNVVVVGKMKNATQMWVGPFQYLGKVA